MAEFLVVIRFTEPTYDEHQGRREAREHTQTFGVVAPNRDIACMVADLEFRRIERQSSVGWVRAIQSVDVGDLPGNFDGQVLRAAEYGFVDPVPHESPDESPTPVRFSALELEWRALWAWLTARRSPSELASIEPHVDELIGLLRDWRDGVAQID